MKNAFFHDRPFIPPVDIDLHVLQVQDYTGYSRIMKFYGFELQASGLADQSV